MLDSRSQDIICSAPLFRAGLEKLSALALLNATFGSPPPEDLTGQICVNPCPFVVPKARELFDTLGFKVCDVSTSVSKTGSGDVWMSYVLDKSR
jgi:hypothetical protein